MANCDILYDPKTDGNGTFCCPICLYWYETREEKQRCMREKHGYETLEVTGTINGECDTP